jgi:peroxiredoxin
VALDGWIADATSAKAAAPRVLAVSVDQDPRKAARFIQEAAVRLPVYMDGPEGLARSMDLPSLPLTLVLDREGHVAHVARNGSPEELAAVRNTVRALLSEAPAPRVPAADEQKENDGEVSG